MLLLLLSSLLLLFNSSKKLFLIVLFPEPGIAVVLTSQCIGSLFITDKLVVDYCKEHQPAAEKRLSPRVIFLSEKPQFASLVSQEAIDQITGKQNEFKTHKTATNRFKIPEYDLLKSTMTLSHASSVAIVTVGVSKKQFAAVICIAKALFAQDKEIAILAPKNVISEWETLLAKCETQEVLMKRVPVTSLDTHSVLHSLGSRFYSTSLNSVVIVNEEGENQNRYWSLVIDITTVWMIFGILCEILGRSLF